MVNNIRNNTISEIPAKKGLNTLNEIKSSEIIKYKKRTPKHKELLNLFNDLLYTILIDKTLMSSKDENENENENHKTLMSITDENEKQNKLLNNDKNANAKNKKISTYTKKKKKMRIKTFCYNI